MQHIYQKIRLRHVVWIVLQYLVTCGPKSICCTLLEVGGKLKEKKSLLKIKNKKNKANRKVSVKQNLHLCQMRLNILMQCLHFRLCTQITAARAQALIRPHLQMIHKASCHSKSSRLQHMHLPQAEQIYIQTLINASALTDELLNNCASAALFAVQW